MGAVQLGGEPALLGGGIVEATGWSLKSLEKFDDFGARSVRVARIPKKFQKLDFFEIIPKIHL